MALLFFTKECKEMFFLPLSPCPSPGHLKFKPRASSLFKNNVFASELSKRARGLLQGLAYFVIFTPLKALPPPRSQYLLKILAPLFVAFKSDIFASEIYEFLLLIMIYYCISCSWAVNEFSSFMWFEKRRRKIYYF